MAAPTVIKLLHAKLLAMCTPICVWTAGITARTNGLASRVPTLCRSVASSETAQPTAEPAGKRKRVEDGGGGGGGGGAVLGELVGAYGSDSSEDS